MEKHRKYKIFSIVALMFAIVGLSVGFAAFSKVLTITAGAIVKPNEEDFNIVGSGSKTDTEDLVVEPEVSGGATADDGVIVNGSDVTSMTTKVYFTAPGQTASYTFYFYNIGSYDGYLKKIEFAPAENSELNKVCIADEGTDETLVEQACESISISITAGFGSDFQTFYETVDLSQLGISFKKGTSATGKFTIAYAEDGVRVDGPFTVKIGNISVYYSTAS